MPLKKSTGLMNIAHNCIEGGMCIDCPIKAFTYLQPSCSRHITSHQLAS